MYWIYADENSKKDIYNCTVSCKKSQFQELENKKNHSITCEEKKEINASNKNSVNDISIIDTDSSFFIDIKELDITTVLLGEGAQGKVFKAKYRKGDVAVKTIRRYSKGTKYFEREINIFSKIRHPNIIQLMGVCIEETKRHFVMPLFDGHSLYDVIFDDQIGDKYNFNLLQKSKIILDMSIGIAYLHLQLNNPIIHRDLKSWNVLVKTVPVTKLCDLGLSRYKNVATTAKTTAGKYKWKGTEIYLPPEVIQNANKNVNIIDTPIDIWALACVVVEIYTGFFTWDLLEYENGLEEIFEKKITPDVSKLPEMIQNIIRRCFSYDPNERPQISEIVDVFDLNFKNMVKIFQAIKESPVIKKKPTLL